jgi:hypothetical protein
MIFQSIWIRLASTLNSNPRRSPTHVVQAALVFIYLPEQFPTALLGMTKVTPPPSQFLRGRNTAGVDSYPTTMRSLAKCRPRPHIQHIVPPETSDSPECGAALLQFSPDFPNVADAALGTPHRQPRPIPTYKHQTLKSWLARLVS